MAADKSRFEIFKNKLTKLMLKSLRDGWSVDTTIVQLKTYKFTVDKTFIDCAQICVPVLLENMSSTTPILTGIPTPTGTPMGAGVPVGVCEEDKVNFFEIFKKDIIKWKKLFEIFFPHEDQIELLMIIQDFVFYNPKGLILFSVIDSIVAFLYEEDLVCEDALFEWEESLKQEVGMIDKSQTIYLSDRLSKFFLWLKE